jgi:hypothetical protein
MNSPLRSSFRIHFFELLIILLMFVVMAARWPWAARVPVHFDARWNANRWGSPWEISVFPILAIGVFFSGLWASTLWLRQENGRKRFNLVLPLIAAPFGAIAGVHFWFWWNLTQLARTSRAPGGWIWVISCAAIVCAVEIPMEIKRQAIPEDRASEPSGSSPLTPADLAAEREIRRNIPKHGRWIYQSSQSAFWISWLLATLGIAYLAIGAWLLHLSKTKPIGVTFLCIGPAMFILAALLGSMTIQITPHHLTLRAGIFRIRLLRIALNDIFETRIIAFRPLADFGGWGIRRAGNTTAFILAGRRGVRLTTQTGKQYVLSSPNPEQLAAAIRIASGKYSITQ